MSRTSSATSGISDALKQQLVSARLASASLATLDRPTVLRAIAAALESAASEIIAANRLDVAEERSKGTPEPLIDRLEVTQQRIIAMASGVRQIADLPDPLGRVSAGWNLANGVAVKRVSVPFGVIGMIYESRPNVTVDAAALALKAGSAAILRGSANALRTNRVLVSVMQRACAEVKAPTGAIQLIDSPDRELVTQLLKARGLVDLVIPRGGAGLIRHVVATATVPVIETGVGNCHMFVDESADLAKASELVLNAKVQRPGVCNSIETLLVHEAVAPAFLPSLAGRLAAAGVELRACPLALEHIPGAVPAAESDWSEEFLSLTLAVKVVRGIEPAIEHIAQYGTQHTEAIVTSDLANADLFQRRVDAAVVAVNASTRFTDGFEFGFGAEIGISTQKLHARGPLGLEQIVAYKYLLNGDGQIRA